MERRRQVDAPGVASNLTHLTSSAILLFFVFIILTIAITASAASGSPQGNFSDGQLAEKAQQLFTEQRWQEIVALVESARNHSADLDFYYGSALAQLDRLADANQAFAAGSRLQPHDKRFPLEMAGVAFKQKDYPRAAHYLRRALHLDPRDAYGNDFLGTVYFLQGNIQAALKYWNRVNKPAIAEVRTVPNPRVSASLLNRAFTFAPASSLQLADLLTSEVRTRELGIFPSQQFDLQARADGKFDVLFRNRERDGWGQTKLEKLFLLFRGLPFLSIAPEYYNLWYQAINFISMYRWDAEKRRVSAELSGPFKGNPKFRYGLVADLRSENWDIRDSFQGPASLLGSLNMRREAVGANFSSFERGRWRWSAGVEASHRDFRSVIPGTALTPALVAKGYQLKQTATVDTVLLRWPERRLTIEGGASSQAGRLWSQPSHSFEKVQGSAHLHWFPRSQGDDYEVQHWIKAGKTFGDVPFDELYMLGLERDNDLWLRGHIGTRNGRKGSAPLGRNFFLSNWEADKNVYGNGVFTVKLGPFLDTGKITDPSSGLGSHQWLWDVGAQVKVRVFGVGVAFSYGKDLRSGNNAFYVTMR